MELGRTMSVNLATATRVLTIRPDARRYDQIEQIARFLGTQAFFTNVDHEILLVLAYLVEYKHAEAGECILSKGQPLDHWRLLLEGSASATHYSSKRGSEQRTAQLAPGDTWSEVALLHSSRPMRSSTTVVAGPQGCAMLQLYAGDYDALADPRQPLPRDPPDGLTLPQLGLPDFTAEQRSAALRELLCCCIRACASRGPPAQRTPEEAAELEPLLGALAAYRAYPQELLMAMASHCRLLSLRPGGLVFEQGTLADAQMTVLVGSVQLRRQGGGEGNGGEDGGGGGGVAAVGTGPGAGGAAWDGELRPPAPPGAPQRQSDMGGAAGGIRARLRREREARKLMQRQIDEYMEGMAGEGEEAEAEGQQAGGGAGGQPQGIWPGQGGRGAAVQAAASASGATTSLDWTKMFMQKAMQSVEPVWKALHPADTVLQRNQQQEQEQEQEEQEQALMQRQQSQRSGGTEGHTSEDEAAAEGQGAGNEMAALLGPAAARAYYLGINRHGMASPSASAPSTPDAEPAGGGGGGGGGAPHSPPRRPRWAFSVEGPETDQERKLRDVAT